MLCDILYFVMLSFIFVQFAICNFHLFCLVLRWVFDDSSSIVVFPSLVRRGERGDIIVKSRLLIKFYSTTVLCKYSSSYRSYVGSYDLCTIKRWSILRAPRHFLWAKIFQMAGERAKKRDVLLQLANIQSTH